MNFYLLLILPFSLIIASISDLYRMRIPNSISLMLLGTFPIVAYQFGFSTLALFVHIAAGLLLFVPGFLLYLIGQVGAGDVKLLSASAIWYGFSLALLEFFILVSIFGALLVLAIFVVRQFASGNVVLNAFLPSYVFVGKKVPYGIAICLAGLITFPDTEIMKMAIQQISTN